ncbi:hypothetical protein TcasGA2_TC001883 [Tribolium castaneum]|uniref:Uncharacterized protein n=1 Tax=Tribolium castaneum TaxID=7070 RepID=D7EJP7_TRICA|nr:hypothetical protein TcasGA2_TC001883 [Tribolium castaneum]
MTPRDWIMKQRTRKFPVIGLKIVDIFDVERELLKQQSQFTRSESLSNLYVIRRILFNHKWTTNLDKVLNGR